MSVIFTTEMSETEDRSAGYILHNFYGQIVRCRRQERGDKLSVTYMVELSETEDWSAGLNCLKLLRPNWLFLTDQFINKLAKLDDVRLVSIL